MRTRAQGDAARRVNPHRRRGRRSAGKSRRQAGIGLRSGCGRARRATRRAADRARAGSLPISALPAERRQNWRRAEPAARWVRPRGGRGRAGAVSLPISALPAADGQNPRHGGIRLCGGRGRRSARDADGQNPAARRDRPHRRRGRAGYARTQAAGGRVGRRGTQNRRQAGLGRAEDAGGRRDRPHGERGRRSARDAGGQGMRRAGVGRTGDAGGRALYPCQYPPFPRRTGKTRGTEG